MFSFLKGGSKPPQGGTGNPEMPGGGGNSTGGLFPESAKPVMPAQTPEMPKLDNSTPSTTAGGENLPNTAAVLPGAETTPKPEGSSSMLGNITGSNMNSTEAPNQLTQEMKDAKADAKAAVPEATAPAAVDATGGTSNVESAPSNIGGSPTVEDATNAQITSESSSMDAKAPEVPPAAVADTTTSLDLSGAVATDGAIGQQEEQTPTVSETHMDAMDPSPQPEVTTTDPEHPLEAVSDTTPAVTNQEETHVDEPAAAPEVPPVGVDTAAQVDSVTEGAPRPETPGEEPENTTTAIDGTADHSTSPLAMATGLRKPEDEDAAGQSNSAATSSSLDSLTATPAETATNQIPNPDATQTLTGTESASGQSNLGAVGQAEEVAGAAASATPPVETVHAVVDSAASGAGIDQLGTASERITTPATPKYADPAGISNDTATEVSQGENILDQVESHVNSLPENAAHRDAAEVVNSMDAPHLDTPAQQAEPAASPTPEPAMAGVGVGSLSAVEQPTTATDGTGNENMPPSSGGTGSPASGPVIPA